MNEPTAVGETTKEYLRKFPQLPSKSIARLLLKDNPTLYANEEQARCSVRYYRQAMGRGNRSRRSPDDPLKREHKNPWDHLPLPKAEWRLDWHPRQVDGPRKVLVLADTHVPYHENAPIDLAIGYGVKRGADTILLNGDIADCHSASHWLRDPRERDFKEEIALTRQLFGYLRYRFPKAEILWKLGNHEERYQHYMWTHCPDIFGLPQFSEESIYGTVDFGIEIVRDMRTVRLGKLNVLHGHEFRFAITNPVNPARGLFLKAQTLVCAAHFHQSSHHGEKTLEDKVVSAWSMGCLCDMHPRYRPLNKWNWGFQFVEVDKDGAFDPYNLRIIDGKVY